MAGRVYVVLALDTEGPVVDARQSTLLPTWDDVDRFVDKLCDADYRRRVPDSCGKGLVISWFVLTWTGFRANPVGRDLGYHKVHDHYHARWAAEMQAFGDGEYWHYHHPARSGIATEWSTDWSTSTEYLEILSRLVIDRWYFPSVFRAGGAIESNELSNWLEQWIPIDYSSRAAKLDWDHVDFAGVRVRDISDWSRAPRDWSIYHPSHADYQTPGVMRRVILRCPDLLTGLYALSDEDVEHAFERAASGHDTVLATFDHDYRDRAALFGDLLDRISRVATRHPGVPWQYANALDAAQAVLGWESRPGPVFAASCTTAGDVSVTADRELFGPRPFVVCHDADTGEYVREEPEQNGERRWLLRPGNRRPCVIGIAASDRFGNVGLTQFAWNGAELAAIERPAARSMPAGAAR